VVTEMSSVARTGVTLNWLGEYGRYKSIIDVTHLNHRPRERLMQGPQTAGRVRVPIRVCTGSYAKTVGVIVQICIMIPTRGH